MDIRELEIFLSVAETLNFGRASQLCNLSPSALTRTIQKLEEQVEQPLFLRDNRTVTLSAAGERFRDYARRAVLDWHSFRASVGEGDAVSGSCSIYASITAVYSLLPQLLETYRSRYPEVQLELRTGAAEQAVGLVQSGAVDLAVAPIPERQISGLQSLPLVTIPLVFIAPRHLEASLPLSEGRLDLSRAPLVLPQTGLSRRRLDQWLKQHRITPNVRTEVSGNEAIIAMVRLGCGVGIVPELVLEKSPFREDVVLVEQAPQLEPYVVGLCTGNRTLQRPSVRALWQLAEEMQGRQR